MSAFIGTLCAMNHEATVRTLRESLIGKTFAGDPEAFKELEAAKVRRNLARNPKHYEQSREAWHAKRRGNAHG